MLRVCLSLLGVACLASCRAETDDAASLVQARVEAEAGSELGTSRMDWMHNIFGNRTKKAQTPKKKSRVDCDLHPDLCKEPFNCQDFGRKDDFDWMVNGMAKNGHANPHAWCASVDYEPYAKQCLQTKDLMTAAWTQYNWTRDTHPWILEIDASYCFIEGHCTNTAVTEHTTLDEADKMCDERFGKEAWNKFPSLFKSDLGRFTSHLTQIKPKDGFHSREATKFFMHAACAMGNYHCDVIYCRETYCKMPHYQQNYKHLEPETPGHLLRELDRPSWLPHKFQDPHQSPHKQ